MTNRRSFYGGRGDDIRVLDVEFQSQTAEETMQPIRYIAVTCEPDDFVLSGNSLRHYGGGTELFIAMTMCNESEDIFSGTMNSIMKNVAHLCTLNGSKTWGGDGWKKVVVCIISDGRTEVNEHTLKLLNQMGCYKEDIESTVNGEAVTAHVFEHTLSFGTDTVAETLVDVLFPIRIIFCLKEQRRGKLDSHRWFFNALCPLINPKVCVLLDVGTKPTRKSIYELCKCFHENPHVGGACGEIVPAGRFAGALVAVRNFGQGVSNIFHKPIEINPFDCVSFFPGLFSAYRYEAMSDNPYGPGPLTMYLRGESLPGGTTSEFTEHQILFHEIVTKRGENWALRHVKSARASLLKDTI